MATYFVKSWSMALDSTCRFKQYITCMYTSKCYRIKKHSCTVVPSYTTNVSLSLELELLKLKGTHCRIQVPLNPSHLQSCLVLFLFCDKLLNSMYGSKKLGRSPDETYSLFLLIQWPLKSNPVTTKCASLPNLFARTLNKNKVNM